MVPRLSRGNLGDATMNGGSSVLSWRNDFPTDGDSKAEPSTLCLISRIGKSLVVDNLLANPGFETGEITPEWEHLTDPAGATTTIDGAVAHGGHLFCKGYFFSGTEDVNYFHVTQNVSVAAGVTYRLRGYVRTLDLTTDSGMRLEVQDTRGESYFTTATDVVNGTSDWTYVDTNFTVPSGNYRGQGGSQTTFWLRADIRQCMGRRCFIVSSGLKLLDR